LEAVWEYAPDCKQARGVGHRRDDAGHKPTGQHVGSHQPFGQACGHAVTVLLDSLAV